MTAFSFYGESSEELVRDLCPGRDGPLVGLQWWSEGPARLR